MQGVGGIGGVYPQIPMITETYPDQQFENTLSWSENGFLSIQ